MPLPRQTITVELADGAVHQLQAINPDYVRVESELPKFGLPTNPKAAPIGYMTCVAWAAAKRTGVYDGTLLDWKNRDCVVMDLPNADDDDQGDVVPPTIPGHDTV